MNPSLVDYRQCCPERDEGESGKPTIVMHLPRRKSGARLGDGLSAVWSLAECRVPW